MTNLNGISHRSEIMTVIIEQGDIKIVSMGGVVLGQSNEEDRKIMEAQRKFYRDYDQNVYRLIEELLK